MEGHLKTESGSGHFADACFHALFQDQFLHRFQPVSYTHLRAHETVLDLVCRLLLEKKNKTTTNIQTLNNKPPH